MLDQLIKKQLQQTISEHDDIAVSVSRSAKLSRLQKNTLIWLCRRYVEVEARGEQVHQPGIQIFVKAYEEKRETLSTRAAVSRAVRLMEERGLIIRSRQGRGLYLSFTDEGREVAQPLYDEAKAEQMRQQQANG